MYCWALFCVYVCFILSGLFLCCPCFVLFALVFVSIDRGLPILSYLGVFCVEKCWPLGLRRASPGKAGHGTFQRNQMHTFGLREGPSEVRPPQPLNFAESRAGGKLVGRARLVDCLPVPRSSFMEHMSRHYVPSLSEVPYKRFFAWVLKEAERFKKPFVYKHRRGAVIWIKV